MRIMMVASESCPLCKTGGLADVVYSLSKELAIMGEDVSIIIPFYETIRETNQLSFKKIVSFPVSMSWRNEQAEIYSTYHSGITFFLVSNHRYFDRHSMYGENDDNERFAFFTLACKTFINKLKKKPDIIHVHDWHAGMLPCLIKEDEEVRKYLSSTKIIFSIHNPAFQGMMNKSSLGDYYNLPDYLYERGTLRFKDQVSSLKSAIVYADKITTVSPNHREELLSVEGGMGLDGVLELRKDDFYGILNGIDYLEFNPEDDNNLVTLLNEESLKKCKNDNKKALLKELNIKDFGGPLFSLVSRLTWQKGMDILEFTIEDMILHGANLIVLGSGEYRYADMFERLRRRYPEHIAIYIGYNNSLAHRIYASSDFFLMPSLFEPCGLGQMIAQRYGALPIVRRTGGLKDSVIGFDNSNSDIANGFSFDEYSIEALKNTISHAMETYKNSSLCSKLMHNAYKTDNSWKKSASQYYEIYKNLV